MSEVVRFHFDPGCPWAWQSSRWIREVAKVRGVEVEWRLFSLAIVNADKEDPLADAHAKGTAALRSLVLVRREGGNDGVDRVYRAIGERTHERAEPLGPAVVGPALEDAGFDPGLLDAALADDSTMDDVRAEHDSAVAEVGCFGVPTLVVESGKGLFGPVIADAPTGEEAGELWDHVRWMIEKEGLFELKRERDRKPGAHQD